MREKKTIKRKKKQLRRKKRIIKRRKINQITETVRTDAGSVFELFDKYDDELIASGLKKEVMETYVYNFIDAKGKQITGLSKIGVDMACRELANRGEVIREMELNMSDDGDYANFFGRCGRFKINQKTGQEVLLETKICQKRQWKFIELKKKDENGKPLVMPNKFWFEQGGQKCIRNGRRDLIPEKLIVALIGEWMNKGFCKTIQVADTCDYGPGSIPRVASEYAAKKAGEHMPDTSPARGEKRKLNFKAGPDDICPIGKHKGQKCIDLPLDYINWLAENHERPEEVKALVAEKMLKHYRQHKEYFEKHMHWPAGKYDSEIAVMTGGKKAEELDTKILGDVIREIYRLNVKEANQK